MTTILSDRLELVQMPADALEALAAGRHDAARSLLGVATPPGWPTDDEAGFLRFRARQMRKDAAWTEWLVRAIALREPGRPMIGHAGFHGPPGINALKAADAVELGYTVFDEFRRRGYATEAVRALIAWAESEHGIRRFIASIAPDNEPSLALVRRFGFVEVGSHWDEEDGLELEFELRT